MILNGIFFSLCITMLTSGTLATNPDVKSRINCFPEQEGWHSWVIERSQCESRGCTYDTNLGGAAHGPPICYMHPDSVGYKASFACTDCLDNKLLFAELAPLSDATIFDPAIQRLQLTATIVDDNHLQIKIEDKDESRFEVPLHTNFKASTKSTKESATFYAEYTENPFSFRVIRRSTGAVLFDTSLGGFVYSNRFLQLSTKLASSNFYGLGEHEHPSLKHSVEYKTWGMFARDQPGLGEGYPLYGSHPMYMVLEDDGNTHGVFIMNSNAMDFTLIPSPAVIMRTIGGIFDLHIYTGPTPENVVQQHTAFVGRPYLPPYWSLGFHLARWGYNSLDNLKAAVERTRDYGIPLDVIYADIDHMDNMKDFTIDYSNFNGLPAYLSSERDANGLRSVIILDPAVTNNATNYEPWDVLSGNDTFVKWPNGDVMMGYVWPPGKTGFPDFFLERTANVWKDLIVKHSKVIQFDGVWIDMNEPSNFGTNEEKPWNWPAGEPAWSLKCGTSDLDDPPYRTYAISVYDDWDRAGRLSDKTLCMEARLNDGRYKHYDVHNLYGWSQSEPTSSALQLAYPGRRGFVLSRSTFAGSSRYVSHWLGDNVASWTHLRRSIISMLEMSMFGMPHTGPDICGFLDEPSPELCKRWMQLGAFYPYSRNHNVDGANHQDPGYLGPEVAHASKFWMDVRYTIIPYMYTLFYWANVDGSTVARPLFHEFTTDTSSWGIDTQFMLGNALMVAPILEEGNPDLTAYMPKGKWLNHITHELLDYCYETSGQYVTFAGNSDVTLFQRGGSVIVLQGLNDGNIVSTAKTRLEPFEINVVFDCDNQAYGNLFWDDGDSLGTVEDGKCWLISYSAFFNSTGAKMTLSVDHESTDQSLGAQLIYKKVTFHGLPSNPRLYQIKSSSNAIIASESTFDSTYGKFVVTMLVNQPTLQHTFEVALEF